MAASSVNMFMGAFKINWPDPECTITWNGYLFYCRGKMEGRSREVLQGSINEPIEWQ